MGILPPLLNEEQEPLGFHSSPEQSWSDHERQRQQERRRASNTSTCLSAGTASSGEEPGGRAARI